MEDDFTTTDPTVEPVEESTAEGTEEGAMPEMGDETTEAPADEEEVVE